MTSVWGINPRHLEEAGTCDICFNNQDATEILLMQEIPNNHLGWC